MEQYFKNAIVFKLTAIPMYVCSCLLVYLGKNFKDTGEQAPQ